MDDAPPPAGATVEQDGVVFPVDTSILTAPIMARLMAGAYEMAEAAQISAIIAPEDRVLEIGAGIGFISTLIARRNPDRLICVEANPRLTSYLKYVHRLNDVRGAEVLNVVLTNGPDAQCDFYLRRDFWMSSMEPGPNAYQSIVTVPTRGLNDLLQTERINVIVCDVEGAERRLFADADIAHVDRIYLELHDHLTGLAGVRDTFATLHSHGFAYDPRHSNGAVVLFRRAGPDDPLRPYAG